MFESILILQEKIGEPNYPAQELEEAGYRVVTVPKLSVAISWLRVNDPILIVAPVHLIDDNIFDLLRFVRDDFQLKNTKIMLYCVTDSPFTMGMSNAISSAARAMGANAVLIGHDFVSKAFWHTVRPLLSSEKDNLPLPNSDSEPLDSEPSDSEPVPPIAIDPMLLKQMMADQEISQIEM